MQQARPKPSVDPTSAIVVSLFITAGLLTAAGIACAVVVLIEVSTFGQITATQTVLTIGGLVASWALAVFLCAVAWLVRRADEFGRRQQRILSAIQKAPGGASQPRVAHPVPSAETDSIQRILTELAEINANLMLTPAQRIAKGQRRLAELADRLVDDADGALGEGDFATADQALKKLADAVPEEPRIAQLCDRLTEMRQAKAAEDVDSTTRRAENMMAVGSFDQAEAAARELAKNYPDSSEAGALLKRIRREAGVFEAEQRRRLYNDVDRAAEARQWAVALTAAEKLLAACPGSVEAKSVAMQLDTLRDNARIEEVRHLRDEIRDLIERRRFADAVVVSEDLLERFPDTQAAAELRGQIERLRKRARKDNAE